MKLLFENHNQQKTVKLPTKETLASESEVQESAKGTSEWESANVKKQTIEEVVATIKSTISSDRKEELDGKIE